MEPSPKHAAPSRWRSYRDVDADEDPARLGAYLERLASVPAVALEKERSLALLALSPGGSCLDVGCGTGPELGPIADRLAPGGRVAGLDRSRALLAEAERRTRVGRVPEAAALELVAGDAHALPFADGEFDACRADRTLQHLERPEAAVAEMGRVTRPGGRVVLTELRWGLAAPALDRTVTDQVLALMATGGDRRAWPGDRLPDLCAGAGLEVTDSERHTHTVEGDADIAALLDPEWSLGVIVARGAVDSARAERWRESLRDLAARGEALAGIVVVHVAATRPADRLA